MNGSPRFFILSALAPLPSLTILALITGCSGDIKIGTAPREPVQYQAFRSGSYSTLNGGLELMGTTTRWWTVEQLLPTETGLEFQRKYMNQKGEGYHRYSLPSELATRVEVKAEIAAGKMEQVRGFDKFVPDVVNLLPVHEVFKVPLRDPALPERFARELRLWWRATHLLPANLPIPLKANITGLLGDLDLQPLLVDSVVTGVKSQVEERPCLQYSIYYHEVLVDNALIFEQFLAADTNDRRTYREFTFAGGEGKGKWDVWVDPDNGNVCREYDWQEQTNQIKQKESGEMKSFRSNRLIEMLYTYHPEREGVRRPGSKS